MKRIFVLSILAASTLALSGCGSDNPRGFICPAAAALVDAATAVQLRPGYTDPSGLIYKVDLVRTYSDCTYDEDSNRITARTQIDFVATRPPGGDSGQFTVPYFVSVTTGEGVVDKKLYQVQFAFAPGESTSKFTDRVEATVIQPTADKKSTDYELIVGLQLTKLQLDYNRRVGRFAQ